MHIINEQLETQVIDPILDRTRRWHPTLRYLSQTEVHVYALSIAASVVLSLYPFLTVMFSLIRHVFKHNISVIAERALWDAVGGYFPGGLGYAIQDRLTHNLDKPQHARFQLMSLVLLLFTANGVFEPLEVALNRAWGAHGNRSYLKNQLVSFGLIILCGGLVIASAMLTAANEELVYRYISIHIVWWLQLAIFKLVAIPLTMLALFLTYSLLPNCRVPLRPLIRVSVVVGGALEVLKYVVIFIWPWLDRKLNNEYDFFKSSVEVILLSMLASFIVLAGAEWTARQARTPAIPPSPLPNIGLLGSRQEV